MAIGPQVFFRPRPGTERPTLETGGVPPVPPVRGGGVQGGTTCAGADEFRWHSVEDRVHVHDLHATILHLMGFDHTKLTYRHGGRDYRLTDVYGNVMQRILKS